nr:hypothetical protein Iba_scaffold16352CG0010 [Ipomoea batatas]
MRNKFLIICMDGRGIESAKRTTEDATNINLHEHLTRLVQILNNDRADHRLRANLSTLSCHYQLSSTQKEIADRKEVPGHKNKLVDSTRHWDLMEVPPLLSLHTLAGPLEKSLVSLVDELLIDSDHHGTRQSSGNYGQDQISSEFLYAIGTESNTFDLPTKSSEIEFPTWIGTPMFWAGSLIASSPDSKTPGIHPS